MINFIKLKILNKPLEHKSASKQFGRYIYTEEASGRKQSVDSVFYQTNSLYGKHINISKTVRLDESVNMLNMGNIFNEINIELKQTP